jgi:holin-like protein
MAHLNETPHLTVATTYAPVLPMPYIATLPDNECMIDLLRGTAILVAIFMLGTFLHTWGVPIPGSVLALLLLYAALLCGLLKLAWVERAAGFLLRHMVLLFVPLTVGLMDVGGVLAKHIVAILVSLVVSFLAVLLITGLLAQKLLAPAAQSGAGEPRP